MKKLIFLLTFLVSTSINCKAQQLAPFKMGDRIAFVGNSITHGGHYHSYIWLYYMTHFPYLNIWIDNCGVGGDTSLEILKRLDGDVFKKNPNVILLTFGMNDSGYFEYNGDNAKQFADSKVEAARVNFGHIVKRLKGLEDTRIIMLGTSPYDQTSMIDSTIFKNKNDAIQRMIAFQRDTAVANHWEFIDFNEPMVELNAKYQKQDPKYSIVGAGRVHPDNDGHMVMAYLFLKAQGMVGKKVADINVNASKMRFVKSDNCTLSNPKKRHGVISFDYLANSLPYPLDTISRGWEYHRTQAQVIKTLPTFMQDIDDEHLTVTGLKGKYKLTIDNQEIGVFSAKQLRDGINLAQYTNTPQYQQALAVMMLNEERLEIESKFRDYAWLQYDYFMDKGVLDCNNQRAVKIFQKGEATNGWVAARREIYDKMIHQEVRDTYINQMKMLVDTIYEVNKPQKRTITLTPIK